MNGKDQIYSTISFGLVVACVLSTIPILEMGRNDDWSYTFIARGLAESGHLRYDGWATPMIGLQAWWAALLIRLFGFSFTLVRFSTLPFAAGCAVLIYRLGRYAGLSPSLSLFGTLTVTLSPLFIPLAASFMTDVPGFFFWLACIYGGLRAARATRTARACGWIAAAAGLGVAGGTVRQAVWVVPLLVIPSVAWIRRKERVVVASAAVCWCAAALVIMVCLRWFQAQPYVEIENYSIGLMEPFSRETVTLALRLLVACLTFALPILLMHLTIVRNKFPSPWELILGLLLGLLLIGALLEALAWLLPERLLLGNIVTTTGIISSGTDTLGGKPVILTAPILLAIKIVLFASGGATIALLLDSLWIRFRRRAPVLRADRTANRDAFRLFVFLYVPPVAAYVLALLYHSLDSNALFDRYLIELLPLLAIALLWHYQRRIRPTVPMPAWASLAFLALYGIATTHDAFAAARARVRAASAVVAAGVPRTRITAGFEYDGWTELEHSGYINADDIENPPGAYRPQENRRHPLSPGFWFWEFTPSIEPSYFVVYSRVAGLLDSPFPPVSFTTWLPPFHRQVFTQSAAEYR